MAMRALSIILFGIFLAAPVSAQRLPTTVLPSHYDLSFTVDLGHAQFDGEETIKVDIGEPTRSVVLNAAEIEFHETTIAAAGAVQKATVSLDAANETATLTVPQPIAKGAA